MEEFDFIMESRLRKESPALHRIFSDNVVCCQRMLRKYSSVFPSYTDHTALHSLEVIAFCNKLIGYQLDKLNCDEIFILLMGAYLHDTGMGISQSDFSEFAEKNQIIREFVEKNPDSDMPTVIRNCHHELSGCYVNKYADFFDFPAPEYVFAVAEVCRGHRKTDLTDDNEFPNEYKLPNGNTVHLPYLAALIRLADELDIAIDRNIQFLYNLNNGSISGQGLIEFKKHNAIKEVRFEDDRFVACVDFSDEEINGELNEVFQKLAETLDYCVYIIETRTPFVIYQRKLEIAEYKAK